METEDLLAEISNFIFTSKYARFNERLKRRETWDEAVNRLEEMHLKKYRKLPAKDLREIEWAFSLVRSKRVVPSMRSLQFGGKAIESKNERIYNCAVRHVDSIRAFSEIFFALLCGNGVGIGLSYTFLNRLPNLVDANDKTGTVVTYVIEDTIEGWADSVEALMLCYMKNTAYTGRKLVFDYSKIRKKGAPLKTGGGKAPGYKGLKNTHQKIKEILDYIIEEKLQRRLKSIDVYDILMHCADAVLSGGVRRSACSIIFDKTDEDMLSAKTYFKCDKKHRFGYNEDTGMHYGDVTVNGKKYHVEMHEKRDAWDYENLQKENKISWRFIEPQRARSNNSVLLLRSEVTLEEFKKIIKRTREFGEPGFVFSNHPSALFNPCFEINFLPVTEDGICGMQMCNLTSINGRSIKNFEDYLECTKAATIIGTLQAGYTKFEYLNNAAKSLTDEEALLGVSITGIMDSPDILLNYEYQKKAAQHAVQINKEWAKKIGINQAARITCVKPEGTSSLVLGSGSGIHPHHAKRYIRRVQCNKLDNVYKFFKKHNPQLCEESVWSANKTDDIISFPIEVADGTMLKPDLSALKHLEIIKNTQQNWVETGKTDVNKKNVSHNVSCTVVCQNNEWDDVVKYLFENRDYFSAVSLLGACSDKEYPQAPMESMTTEEELNKFEELKARFKTVDYTKMVENEDETAPQSEMVCAGGSCEIVRI
jgi:ribonucleoside-diphosphate reductase alpha chain